METAFALGILAIAAGVTLRWFSQRRIILRTLRYSRRVPIADFPPNAPAKVVGKLSYCAKPLVSPLTGRPCAYYEIHVEKVSNSGGEDAGWSVIRESAEIEFRITDESAQAIVNPANSHIVVHEDSLFESGGAMGFSAAEEKFLRRYGERGERLLGQSLRFREGILEEGEEVAVFGFGLWESDPEAASQMSSYRERPKRLRLAGSRQTPLYISDKPETRS